MNTSIYDLAIAIQKEESQLFFEHINELGDGIFSEIVEDLHLGDEITKKAIVMYIIYAYSLHSRLLILNHEDKRNKKRVAQFTEIPEHLLTDVIELRNTSIRTSVIKYLEQQKEDDWNHLNRKQMLYNDLDTAGLMDFLKEDGGVDRKKLLENAKYTDTLKEQIEELKSKLTVKYKTINDHEEELHKITDDMKKEGGGTLRLESIVDEHNK